MSTTAKSKRKKGKDSDILPKPKRPMSAYNFFFREQRNKILETGDDVPDNEKKKSFEDIGRVIGQRWREIAPEELAKYQEWARQDAERYRKEMKVFYEEELALMCSGQGTAPPAEADKAAADQQADHKELMQKMQQQLHQCSAPGQERFAAMSPTSAAPAAASAGVASAQASPNQATTANVMDVEQLIQLQNMLQGNKKSFIGKLNKADLANEISAQRAVIQQRLVTLLQESEMLRVKDRLLEQLFSNLSEAGSGNSSSDSGLTGSMARPAAHGLNPFPQATFSHTSHATPTPVANNFGLGGAAASMMMPSLGQLLNQPQQGLTTDNTSFINQLIASQQQHQQFANSMGASAASTSFTNHSSTTSDETSDQASKQNNQAPMNLQALLGQNGNGVGNLSQGQGAGAFGLAGSTFNSGNSTQPHPDVAAFIAQLMASQQNQNKPPGT